MAKRSEKPRSQQNEKKTKIKNNTKASETPLPKKGYLSHLGGFSLDKDKNPNAIALQIPTVEEDKLDLSEEQAEQPNSQLLEKYTTYFQKEVLDKFKALSDHWGRGRAELMHKILTEYFDSIDPKYLSSAVKDFERTQKSKNGEIPKKS